jgi:hypothetical protein
MQITSCEGGAMISLGWRAHQRFARKLKGLGPISLLATNLFEYAEKTKIVAAESNCFAGWETAGLSNLRGFAPHRRIVLINRNDPFIAGSRTQMSDEGLESFFFHMHDLLHIFYYDWSLVQYGALWERQEFFVPAHLTSEALAVLALDYWALAKSEIARLGSNRFYDSALAVEVHDLRLQRFGLKGFDSKKKEFISELLKLYNDGRSSFFRKLSKSKTALLKTWALHEVNYSEKQHRYVLCWWDFLNGHEIDETRLLPIFRKDPEAIQHLLDIQKILFSKNEKLIAKHISDVRCALPAVELPGHGPNYFQFRAPLLQQDYRFLNAFCLKEDLLKQELMHPDLTNPSFHYLVGQLLTSLDPAEEGDLVALAHRIFSRRIMQGKGLGSQVAQADGLLQRLLIEELQKRLPQIVSGASLQLPEVFFLS